MRLVLILAAALLSGCGVYIEAASGAIGTTGFVKEVRRAETTYKKGETNGKSVSVLEELIGENK